MKDVILDQLLEFTIVHGRAICDKVLYENPNPLPKVNISEDLHVVTVVDKHSMSSLCANRSNFQSGKLNLVILDEFKKWVSKIKGLREYIESRYNSLPTYILFLDGFDTLILRDITNPQALLDHYNCKILFNSEPYFLHTGFPPPEGTESDYYRKLYYDEKQIYKKLNEKKYEIPFENGLNAGVFLGHKDYILKLLLECEDIMEDTYLKGFPYGCQDDQCVLRYLHNKYFDIVSVDIFNKYMFWGSPLSFKEPDGIHGTQYFKKYN